MTSSVNPENESKEKFHRALEKKLATRKSNSNLVSEKMKIKGSQSAVGGQRLFRRKSGTS